jgi:hypothetical protein
MENPSIPPPGGNGNGNGGKVALPKELQDFLGLGSFDGMFSGQEIVSAIKMLIEPGNNARGMTMRSDIPQKKTPAHIWLIALARHMAKNREFSDDNASQEVLDLFASFPSVDGKRINQLVDAVTGQRSPQQGNQGGSTTDRLRRWAQM